MPPASQHEQRDKQREADHADEPTGTDAVDPSATSVSHAVRRPANSRRMAESTWLARRPRRTTSRRRTGSRARPPPRARRCRWSDAARQRRRRAGGRRRRRVRRGRRADLVARAVGARARRWSWQLLPSSQRGRWPRAEPASAPGRSGRATLGVNAPTPRRAARPARPQPVDQARRTSGVTFSAGCSSRSSASSTRSPRVMAGSVLNSRATSTCRSRAPGG